ncbi:MAG: M17 family peptidase N-terminal domain-containing protein, partial [Actinomycetota bacterium]
ALAAVDAALGGLVSAVIDDGEVSGAAGQVRVLHTRGDIPASRVLLAAEGADDVLVIVGGTIPGDDADELRALGVAAVYTPGAPVDDMVSFLEGAVAA